MQIKAGSKVIRITPNSVLEIGKEYRINTVKSSHYDVAWFTLEGFGDTLFHSDFFKLGSAEPPATKQPTLAEAKQLLKQAEQNISEYIQKIMQEFQTNSGVLDAKLEIKRFERHNIDKANPDYIYDVSIEA